MHKLLLTIFLALVSSVLFAQEEFFRESGGISASFGLVKSSEGATGRSFGFSASMPGGFTVGLSTTTSNEETYPTFLLGYLGPKQEKPGYMRGKIFGSYTSLPNAYMVGLSFELSYVINAQRGFPTALGPDAGMFYLQTKKQDGGLFYVEPQSDMIPVFGVHLTQGFFAKSAVSPYLSVAYSYEANNSTTTFGGMVGLLIHFNRQKKE